MKRLLCALMFGLLASDTEAKPRLAALHPNAVVLFQGDSITEGGRWPGDDPNHIMGQDYAYMVAGQLGLDYAGRNLVFVNRGVSGNTVLDLQKRWKADIIDLHPDVLSILVGVNDTFYSNGETVETYEQVYDALIADTLRQLPDVKIILGESFLMPVRSYAEDYAAKRALLAQRQAVVERLAVKYHLPLVRYQDVFDAALKDAPADHWSWDGVHPTYAGHALMARAWIEAVDKAWRK